MKSLIWKIISHEQRSDKVESSHDKDEYFTIGDCDLCGEDNRYVEHGKDTFGVHVIDHCAYGCNNEKSKVNVNNPEEM